MISQQEAAPRFQPGGLEKLIYVISGAAVAYGVVMRLGTQYLIRVLHSGDIAKGNVASQYTYPGVLVVYLATMIAVALAFRPLREAFVWEPTARGHWSRTLRHVGYGIIGGLVCCAIAVPFMWGHGGSNAAFLVQTAADAYGLSLGGTLMILLLALAIPVVSEVVFRGIVLRSLARLVSVPAAVVASTLLFALWYPVLGWYGSVALGVISAFLYVRTRTLTASVVANSVLSVGSAAIILAVAFR